MSGRGNLSVASNGEDAAIGGVQDDASSAAPAPSQAAAGHGLRRLPAPGRSSPRPQRSGAAAAAAPPLHAACVGSCSVAQHHIDSDHGP